MLFKIERVACQVHSIALVPVLRKVRGVSLSFPFDSVECTATCLVWLGLPWPA